MSAVLGETNVVPVLGEIIRPRPLRPEEDFHLAASEVAEAFLVPVRQLAAAGKYTQFRFYSFLSKSLCTHAEGMMYCTVRIRSQGQRFSRLLAASVRRCAAPDLGPDRHHHLRLPPRLLALRPIQPQDQLPESMVAVIARAKRI